MTMKVVGAMPSLCKPVRTTSSRPVMEAMGSKFSHQRDSVTLIGAATDLTELDMNDAAVPMLYDGWTAHLPPALLEEFKAFIEHKNPLPPMARTKLQCRGTMGKSLWSGPIRPPRQPRSHRTGMWFPVPFGAHWSSTGTAKAFSARSTATRLLMS